MKWWMISLVMAFGSVHAQDNTFKQFLAQNMATMDPGGDSCWRLLKQDAAEDQLIILGESHGAADAQSIDFSLLKYLNRTFGVRTYVAELDYSQAVLVNEYLRTGDEHPLKTVFRTWVKEHEQWGNADFYHKIVKIRALNQTLPTGKRIHFVGIDMVQDFDLYLQLIRHCLGGKKSPLLDSARELSDTDLTRVTEFAGRFVQTIQQNRPAFEALFGTGLPVFEYLLQNLSYSSSESGVKRPEGLFRNYKQLYAILHWENEKLYGMWGFFHAHLTPFYFIGDDFASKLAASDHASSKKILSVICLPLDSKYTVWDSQTGAWSQQPFSYDDASLLKVDGIEDLRDLTNPHSITLFRLDGPGSPFPKTGRLVNGSSPRGWLRANFKDREYANQYVVLMRNSEGLHTLPGAF